MLITAVLALQINAASVRPVPSDPSKTCDLCGHWFKASGFCVGAQERSTGRKLLLHAVHIDIARGELKRAAAMGAGR